MTVVSMSKQEFSRHEVLLRVQSNRLEALLGNRAGQHSIRVNDRWRLCFTWRDGEAWDVEIVDYHGG
jgi:proteic killer suppression protein